MLAFKVADDRNAYGNRWKKWTTRIILPISSLFLSSPLYISFARIDLDFPFLDHLCSEIFLKILTRILFTLYHFSFDRFKLL